ncbi:hypothetical protein [Brevundimonas sp. NIBR11]|uniref:COG2958 family protein n=1 Tax=Brevundimonas sp. NIBR11 TaxID=3015999 RepID=UPI0022F0E4EB|nr:hypothetical protein [Brevundimonas sp. NIBR11]
MKLNQAVAQCLRDNPGQRFKAREIAQWIIATYPEATSDKLRRSSVLQTEEDLRQQLVAEIGANRPAIQQRHSQIKTTEDRPRLYYWSDTSDEAEVRQAEGPLAEPTTPADSEETSRREHDLYPLLSVFLASEFGVLSRRVDEKRSSNARGPQGNQWLFPDLVGMEDLTRDWQIEVKQLVNEASGQKARLWSFEVKLLLNRSNVRAAYFQAVSNSSWANFGYLVATTIQGAETIRELRMLSALHGIGVIKLDADNPPESQVLIPARQRETVDWANCSRLAEENADFREIVGLVRQFHQTGDPRVRDWDRATMSPPQKS